MSIGDRLKEVRNIKGMTQFEMGNILNIPQSNLYRYENGSSKLTADKIELLYQNGINIEWLITGQGEIFYKDKKEHLAVSEDNILSPLKKIRKEKGFTQEELADKLGISRNYLSEIETGKVALTNRLRTALGELGLFIAEKVNGIVSIPLIDISASAGLGIVNLAECPQISLIDVPSELLDIPSQELQNCHAIKVRGNSMTPVLENGDRVVVKEVKEVPIYTEGLFIIIYDSELFVKKIQLGNNKLIMKSINQEFDDIIIPNLSDLDVHLQIVAKVMTIIRSV